MIRILILQPLLGGILVLATCSSNTPAISPALESTAELQAATDTLAQTQSDSSRVDYFNANIRPVLEKRCQPCHFEGGKMYAQLPFDNPKTIRRLGTKLFSRIHEEHEQDVIRTFLAQPVDSAENAVVQ